MHKILLKITGTQQITGDSDKTELTMVADMTETEDEYIISYTEEHEAPLAPVSVSVRIDKMERTVEMVRSGPFNTRLMIEKSRRNLCHYGTEYGDILMGISGHGIENRVNGERGSFRFSYDIDINGAMASKNEVKMSFRKNLEQPM